MTTYKIFFRAPANTSNAVSGDANAWTLLTKTYDAGSGDAAAKAAALDHNKPGQYAAIPARSWDPVKLEIETNPRVKVVK